MPHLTENLKNFVRNESWTYAKTMPEWPHEYIVRRKVNEFLFIELVGYIRENGYQVAFYDKSLTYFVGV